MFGISSSPFLLNATIRFHLEQYLEFNEWLIHRLLQSMYFDYVITGGEAENKVLSIHSEAKQIFRNRVFNLRNFGKTLSFARNKLMRRKVQYLPNQSLFNISKRLSEATLMNTQAIKSELHKVLGMPWNPSTDCFIFDAAEVAQFAKTL